MENKRLFKDNIRKVLQRRKERLVDRSKLTMRREGAVLVPILFGPEEEPHLLLTKRSKKMRSNPGDMAFPGGKLDKGEGPVEGALREAEEEVGLKREEVEILGLMDEYVSSNQTVVRAVIGAIEVYHTGNFRDWAEEKYSPKTEENVLTLVIPLSHFLNPRNYSSRKYNLGNSRWGYVRYFDISEFLQGETVWGLTATIIRRFLDLFFDHSLPEEPLS